MLFISKGHYAQASKDNAYLDVAPELVVEVLSPDDRAGEVARKIAEYFEAGVPPGFEVRGSELFPD